MRKKLEIGNQQNTMYLMKDFTKNYQRNAFTTMRVSYHEGYVIERETATGWEVLYHPIYMWVGPMYTCGMQTEQPRRLLTAVKGMGGGGISVIVPISLWPERQIK